MLAEGELAGGVTARRRRRAAGPRRRSREQLGTGGRGRRAGRAHDRHRQHGERDPRDHGRAGTGPAPLRADAVRRRRPAVRHAARAPSSTSRRIVVPPVRRQLLRVGPARRRPRPHGVADADHARSTTRAIAGGQRRPGRAVRRLAERRRRRRGRRAGGRARHALRRPGALPDRRDAERRRPHHRRRRRAARPVHRATTTAPSATRWTARRDRLDPGDGAHAAAAAGGGAPWPRPAGAAPAAPSTRGRSRAASGCRSRSSTGRRSQPGASLSGPAILLEETATTYLDAGWRARRCTPPGRSSSSEEG